MVKIKPIFIVNKNNCYECWIINKLHELFECIANRKEKKDAL